MNFRCAWIIAVALPFAAGCQQTRGERDMQRELRFQEDRIYQLEDWIRQYNDHLNCCRDENRGLLAGKPAAGKAPPARPKPLGPIAPFDDSESKGSDAPDIEIPKIEIPGTPDGRKPELMPAPGGASHRGARKATSVTGRQRRVAPEHRAEAVDARRSTVRPAAGEAKSGTAPRDVAQVTFEAPADAKDTNLSPYEAARPKEKAISRITLNRLLTAPLNRDGEPGDDGLMAVVEPRNEAGDLVPAVGSLNIAVIDPAATNEKEARVGRWDFDALQTARLYRRTTLGDGVQLNLLWQDRPPAHNKLDLYVRLTTPDGRKLQTKRTIEVALPAASSPHEVSHPEHLVPEPIAADDATMSPVPAAAVEKMPQRVNAAKGGAIATEAEPLARRSPGASQPAPIAGIVESGPIPTPIIEKAPQPGALSGAEPLTKPIARAGEPSHMFQVVPIAQAPASATPMVSAALMTVPPAAVAPQPMPAAALATPATLRAATPAKAAPLVRKARITPPPADEQVALPPEPGEPAEASLQPTPPPSARRPQWAPFRK